MVCWYVHPGVYISGRPLMPVLQLLRIPFLQYNDLMNKVKNHKEPTLSIIVRCFQFKLESRTQMNQYRNTLPSYAKQLNTAIMANL